MTENTRQVDNSGSTPNVAKGNVPSYNPPSYDYATGGDGRPKRKGPAPSGPDTYKHVPPPAMQASPPYAPTTAHGPSSAPGNGTVYHYQHNVTGQVISTVLPPDHPEMLCLQEGRHVRATRYGLLGILAAVFWFPLGIGLCLLDRRIVCTRCGHVIDDGLSC